MARPLPDFNHFIGQARSIKFLRQLAFGSKKLGEPCPSLLLKAPTGCGKTSLAEALAIEMGTTIHTIFAGDETQAGDVCRILKQVDHADIFLIDEAHSLKQNAQQILYNALDKYKIPTTTVDGKLNRSEFESIAKFTLILATNEPGYLKPALRNRLHSVELDSYSISELKAIAEMVAGKLSIYITPQAAKRIAEISQGVPRSIYKHLDLLKILCPQKTEFTIEHIRDLLAYQGIDEFGLYPKQRQYLDILDNSPSGICTLDRLSSLLGTDIQDIRRSIEPYLINQGMVDPNSSRGRKITHLGRKSIRAWQMQHSNIQSESESE